VSQRLQNIFSSVPSQGNLAGIGSLGLASSQSGEMEFDSTVFISALGESTDDVMEMLIGTSGVFTEIAAEVDLVADPSTGLIQPRLDSFEVRMDDLASRVETQEGRLADYEQSLRDEFVNMELILAKYQSTGDFLTSQLALLTNNNKK